MCSRGGEFCVEILAEMFDRRCARNQQDVRRALKQPRQRDLHRRRAQRRRGRLQHGRLQRSKPSQGKEWHVGYVLPREFVNEGVIVTLRNVVEVLNANDPGDFLCLRQLPRSDITQAEMAD
jgi:hypothetical protein